MTDATTQTNTDHLLNTYDVIIIGGGVAGLSAALYTARDGLSTLVLEGDYVSATQLPGGALLLTPDIENFPGFMEGTGDELITLIKTQALKFGAKIETALAETINFKDFACCMHEITDNNGHTYRAKSIILATGAVARQIGIPGELENLGTGVSTCATCDGFFFQGKEVIVVGGGDTAVEDAIFLRAHASKVTMIVRGEDLRAKGPEARQALELSETEGSNFNIVWNTTVKEILTDEAGTVNRVLLNTKDEETVFNTDGVFVAVGRDPSTTYLKDTPVLLDDEGYIVTEPGSVKLLNNIPGVFAAGDAVDKKYRQAITSAGKAVEAALEAREYLLTATRNQGAC